MNNTPLKPRPLAAGGRALASLALAGLIVLGLTAGTWYFMHGRHAAAPAPRRRGEPPPEDPRTAYTGPFRNIAPDVKYVGTAACGGGGCHDDKIATYRQHPMGRSMFAIGDVEPAPPEDRAHHNPFDALGSQFRVARDGARVWHRRAVFDEAGRPVYDFPLEVAYALGSGSHGISYLTVRDGGYVFQTPISWYSQKQIWDLSPGFSPRTAPGRPVLTECLYCHADHVEPEPGTINRYKEPVLKDPAISCERCHGPGERHVIARRQGEAVAGDTDATIVNPAHLAPKLREAVCEQCHLAGEAHVVRRGRQLNEFRPGLPLETILTVLVRAAEGGALNKAVNHVEQMHISRCYRASTGENQLGCVSCHDPHVHEVDPAERVVHYRASCLACHEEHPCTLPRPERLKTSPQDSCIVCHMPRHKVGDIPHTAATDHRILRVYRPEDEPHDGPLPGGPGLPVVPYHAPAGPPWGAELERDMAIGMMGPLVALHKMNAGVSSKLTLSVLEAAVTRDPEDWDAWDAKANALKAQDRPREALAALQAILAKEPRRETALMGAAVLVQELGELEPALAYWHRASEINPWSYQYHHALCDLLAHKGAWDELRPQCEAWLRLDPASVDARQAWVSYLLHTGHKDEARVEFDKIRALHPANLAQLQARFDEESK